MRFAKVFLRSIDYTVRSAFYSAVNLGIYPSRSRYIALTSIAFGRRRLRFPASGRRKGSYESLLHAFVKRTCVARFRRVSVFSFKPAVSLPHGDFRRNLLVTVNNCGTFRRRLLSQKLSSTTYLSSA